MDENVFVYEGEMYDAKESVGCVGCAFKPKSCRMTGRPSCSAIFRNDSRSIIWVKREGQGSVEKQQQPTPENVVPVETFKAYNVHCSELGHVGKVVYAPCELTKDEVASVANEGWGISEAFDVEAVQVHGVWRLVGDYVAPIDAQPIIEKRNTVSKAISKLSLEEQEMLKKHWGVK